MVVGFTLGNESRAGRGIHEHGVFFFLLSFMGGWVGTHLCIFGRRALNNPFLVWDSV